MPSDVTVRPGVTEAVIVREEWTGAADRGLRAREERAAIVARVLIPGVDFGIIPGTPKPTLLKPGAEKIADSLNLYPDYERVGCVEDWDKPLFHYAYRCILKARGTDSIVATGIGSCNSMEARYRWRDGKRKCPKCGKEAIIKGKEEYGGGYLCYAKKDGCGAKFKTGDQSIEAQKVGRILNDDVHSQVNTVDKMAQKRSLVAASLNLGFSEKFTQDLEDAPHEEPADPEIPREIQREPASRGQYKVSMDKATGADRSVTVTAPPQEDALGLPPEPGSYDGPEIPIFIGIIEEMWEKSGTRKDRKSGKDIPWTLYNIRVMSAEGESLVFGTFDTAHLKTINDAGKNPVRIVWERTVKGNMNIVSIEAA